MCTRELKIDLSADIQHDEYLKPLVVGALEAYVSCLKNGRLGNDSEETMQYGPLTLLAVHSCDCPEGTYCLQKVSVTEGKNIVTEGAPSVTS